jgi:hypothetical protein
LFQHFIPSTEYTLHFNLFSTVKCSSISIHLLLQFPALREFVGTGKPVWGTCAGLIFLANKAIGTYGYQSVDILAFILVGLNDEMPWSVNNVTCRSKIGRPGAYWGTRLYSPPKLFWKPGNF